MIDQKKTTAVQIWSILLVLTTTASEFTSAADKVVWSGDGQYRLLVRIEASEPATRSTDELPAELQIDFAAELEKLGIDALPDIASIQVMLYDPETGQPKRYANYAYARSPNDRPFRWYDGAIPYEFPDFHDTLTRTKNTIVRRNRTRAGYFYNVLGDWRKGRLAWTHTHSPAPSALKGPNRSAQGNALGLRKPMRRKACKGETIRSATRCLALSGLRTAKMILVPRASPPIIQPRVIVFDINGDGDDDLFLPSTQGSCFVERSFLKNGYARAILTATQQRPDR